MKEPPAPPPSSLSNTSTALAAKCRRLKRQGEESRKRVSSLKGKLVAKRLRVERLKKSLESSKAKNEMLEERIERLEERINFVLNDSVQRHIGLVNVISQISSQGSSPVSLRTTPRRATQQTITPEKLGSLDFGSSSESESEKYEVDDDDDFEHENNTVKSDDEEEIIDIVKGRDIEEEDEKDEEEEEDDDEMCDDDEEEEIAPIEKAPTEDADILSEDEEMGYNEVGDDEDDECEAKDNEEEENEEDIEKEFIKLRKSYSQNLSAEIESDEERQRKVESLGDAASADKVRIMELEEELTRSKNAFIDANAKMMEAQRLYNESKEMWAKFNEEAVMLEKSELFNSLAELTKELGAFKKAQKAEVEGYESLKVKIFEVCAKLNRIKIIHRQIKKSADSPFRRANGGARPLPPYGKRRSVSFDISYTPLRQKRSKSDDTK